MSAMVSKPPIDDINSITTLSDAINLIKFLKVSHKAELNKWMEACKKQAKTIKKLESNRHQELAYLSNQLHKYEFDLLERENNIAKQIADKDQTIDILNKTIESLQEELSFYIQSLSKTRSDSSDSGIIVDKIDNSESTVDEKQKKNRRASFQSINIFRNVDFSPRKKKVDSSPPVSSKKKYSFKNAAKILKNREKSSSEDETSSLEDVAEFLVHSPRKLDESMTNHFCHEPSEIEREKIFDRVMAPASVRKSVKYSKYQKINRNKAKYLEGLAHSCEDIDSS